MKGVREERLQAHSASTTVLARIGHERNRRMLGEFLGDEYVLIEDVPQNRDHIDLIVVDDRRFGQAVEEITDLVRAAEPVFLPVLLLSARDPERFGETVWEAVDEIITVPVAKRELRMRLEGLKTRREASVVLKSEKETSEARFQTLYEAVPDPIVAVSETGTITEVNQPFERLVSMPEEELVGRSITALPFEPETTVEGLLRGDEAGSYDGDNMVKYTAENGDPIVTELNVNVLDTMDGTAERVGIFRDITDRESVRQDLERQNERLDDFTSIVAHDLRNPLTIAAGRIDLARETGNLEHLTRAQEALDYMSTLIGDLLDWSKQGNLVSQKAAVDLGAVGRAAWQMTGAATESSLEVHTGDAQIMADPDRLQQLFENLFRNALEHTSGPVTVRISRLEDGFALEDDGEGFEEGSEDIFEPGFTSTDEGSGLGLATVARIAEAHGWTVTAAQGREGGARFEFRGVHFEPAE